MASPKKDQQHPLYHSDRRLVNELLQVKEPNNLNLADLARLGIRYQGFPGARDIQADLAKLLTKWQLTEPELFALTRKIHSESKVYGSSREQRDDWA